MNRPLLILLLVVLCNLYQQTVAAQQATNKTADPVAIEDRPKQSQRDDTDGASSENWRWILGIILTAIVSPILVKTAENHLSRDPIKEESARLHQVIELQAARQKQGLPPDGRLTALINELTDALGDEAKGKQQALDEATSVLLGRLSCQLLESLYQSCHQLELLLDSKHSSETLSAIFDLTRLEFLRTYWGFRRMAVPQYFMSMKREDLDRYTEQVEAEIETLGNNAQKYASTIGTTKPAVQEFVQQVRAQIDNAKKREASEGLAGGNGGEK